MMLRNTLLALLWLALTPAVWAGVEGPNPGADNPGSRTDSRPFVIFAEVPLRNRSAECSFSTDQWCARQMEEATSSIRARAREACDGEEWCEAAARAAAEAGAIAELNCGASATAQARVRGFVSAEGLLELTRHGNNGSMHHILFEGGVRSATAVVAAVDVGAAAATRASVFTTTDVRTLQDFCDANSNNVAIWNFCLRARAASEAESSAEAVAASSGGAGAMAALGRSGGAGAYNEVWGANLTQYRANFIASTGGLVSVGADAVASVFADAYAQAFATAWAEACAKTESDIGAVEVFNEEFCTSARAEAYAEAEAKAQTWAAAQASAVARSGLQYEMSAFYRNEPGTYENDIVAVGFEGDYGLRSRVSSFCYIPEGEPSGDDAPVLPSEIVVVGPNG